LKKELNDSTKMKRGGRMTEILSDVKKGRRCVGGKTTADFDIVDAVHVKISGGPRGELPKELH